MNGQGIFYDDPTRSPPGNQHRQNSRQPAPFDSYSRGTMGSSTYFGEEPESRFDLGRGSLDRLNTSLQTGGSSYSFDNVASQTWNPQAFANNGFGAGGNAFAQAARTSRPAQQSSRRNLPTGWMEPQMNLPQMNNGFSSMGPPNITTSMGRDVYTSEPDDELIPTAIVIKNIPFAVRKEELVDVMTGLNLPLPYAFNYHFDNGVFRGLAFANFTSAEETAIVIEALNHFELNGRKLRVEYKKMLPQQERERIEREKRERRGQLEEQHRPMATPSLHNPPSMSSLASSRMAATSPSPVDQRNGRQGMPMMKPQLPPGSESPDLNDPQTLQFYNEILLFKGDNNREMLIFPSNLSAVQRRTVHTLAHMMNLGHQSTGSGDQRQVYVQKGPGGANSVSPPLSQASMLQPDANRRTLNRAATTDFSENRGIDSNTYHNVALRGQHSTGYLGLPESPGGFANSSNLRAAKSYADLRSYTPSPAPSTASYAHPQLPGMRDNGNGTPNLTPTTSNNPLLPMPHQQQRSNNMLSNLNNDMSGMRLGGDGPLDPGSPRRLRGMFSWDRESGGQSNPSPAPIGSRAPFSTNVFPEDGGSRLPGAQMPIRQPRGPAPERAPGFARPRQNGQGATHQRGSSDELNQRGQQSTGQAGGNVEIIVEH